MVCQLLGHIRTCCIMVFNQNSHDYRTFQKNNTKLVDLVQAFPQATVKSNIYLHNPPGVVLPNTYGEKILKLLKNLFRLKDAGLAWYEHLTKGLTNLGFVSTQSDPCIFINGLDIIIIYVNDYCIMSPSEIDAMKFYKNLESMGSKVIDEGITEVYFGLQIDSHNDGIFTVS